ncbi:MAG: class I SAM-dependent methyltransferase [Alphaproteobacteria bacterium]|nr:class I SAM-dependent methyltransferase [Alphaproteobacteria bacterium]
MNVDALADLLKSRECQAVCYFHTDHFEPWSTTIDDESAKAVERMAKLARSSPYARRLSLFYSVFVPYRLTGEGVGEVGDQRSEGDQVAFSRRSQRQEDLTSEVIRPLFAEDSHEIHLHVHHEFWTRNSSHFDSPVSRWVNAHSTPDLDSRRLDLHFRLCKDTIAQEIGMPFERWAFIHGNWALNASDPLICHVHDEMAIIMRHGGYGDFSFPAGRSYCDPKLKTPFTCLPLALPRAYDDQRSDPRPIASKSNVMLPERFFIWNSGLKSSQSSLDYYSASNRAALQQPEQVLAAWLAKSVCLGGELFIKTHAHSMNSEYRLGEPDGMIPHCYPATVALFEGLSRVCERAGVELRCLTVSEVMDRLATVDGGHSVHATGPARHEIEGVAEFPVPSASPWTVAEDLSALHQAWLEGDGKQFPADDLYRSKLANSAPLEPYELSLARTLAERFPAQSTRIIEIGMGWGGFAILLARMGFEVVSFEGNTARYTAGRWHMAEHIKRFPSLRGILLPPREGLFPQAFAAAALSRTKTNVGVATNVTHSYTAANQLEIIQAARAFDELIIDLARFGVVRDTQAERDTLRREVAQVGFRPVERLVFEEPYEYWRFASPGVARPAAPAEPLAAPLLPLHGQQGPLFTAFGDQQLKQCPVCACGELVPLWRMPATTLPEAIEVFGGYYNQVPTLQVPSLVYSFDFCRDCESIFLNPVASGQKQEYRRTSHYIKKMRTASEWHEYEVIYDKFAAWIPPAATVMVDAACGIGQYLQVARRRGTHHWQRLVGLELADSYVEHMRSEGIEAYAFDIDNDDISAILRPDSADFISFCEAFEHVERPLDALRKLLTVLRKGGRLFFTAQRYGTDVQAVVRPGEPIYIAARLVDELPGRLGCRVVNVTTSIMRYYIVLEK